MRTLDPAGSESHSWLARAARDVRLLHRLGSMLIHYFFRGARVRRRYRQLERRGGTYWLDEDAPKPD